MIRNRMTLNRMILIKMTHRNGHSEMQYFYGITVSGMTFSVRTFNNFIMSFSSYMRYFAWCHSDECHSADCHSALPGACLLLSKKSTFSTKQLSFNFLKIIVDFSKNKICFLFSIFSKI
jgi:hypothetical protein